ncbi:MAG: YitT family protein [Ruminococcaceae bacterium]|nr:YitT family protein [Oscillospiraceae bacterium]
MAKIRSVFKDYLIIIFGCILYSFSFVAFFQSNSLAMGGFTGISQIINHFIPVIPIGTTVFVLNLPLLLIGFKKEGFRLLVASFFSIFFTSVIIDTLTVFFTFPKTDNFLACIFGSLLLGGSLGILMKKSATTGGTELLAKLLKYKIKKLSIGKVCLIIDLTVIFFYALFFRKLDSALYGIIAIYISNMALDSIIYGASDGKVAYIISDKNKEISDALLKLGFGITILNGKSGFFNKDKEIIICALKKSKIYLMKKTVASIDSDKAFVIICEAKEVFGEGFGDYTGIGF